METALTPASATIDAGRLETIKRRRHFNNLTAVVTNAVGEPTISLSNDEMLSPRRIARKIAKFTADEMELDVDPALYMDYLTAHIAIAMADTIHAAMRDWANTGYPATMRQAQVYPFLWTIHLVYNNESE